jgi:hypothetical protein
MDRRSRRWEQRPAASLLLRAAVFVVPILAALGAAMAASRLLPRPTTSGQFVSWWVALAVIALLTLTLLDRLSRRLLPLAALLTLAMAFPDRAPSRFRVAREAASMRHLQRRLLEARSEGLQSDPARAAEAIITLITALGVHDKRTRGHSERVHVFTELLAEELGLSQDERDRLRWASLLHDIGKLVVSSEILNKPGKPDEDEWAALRRHPEEGAKFIAPLRPFLGEWAAAVDEHHEWYDGSGYPRGLEGREISRSARIVAVADAFEVMTAPRSYRRAVSPTAARQELAEQAGTQFDPAIVRAFLSISIGRLRRAIGPAALLAPLPTALRLTGYTGSVAQVGAVVGGAAVLMVGGFGGSTAPAIGAEDPSRGQLAQTEQVSADVSDADVLRESSEVRQRDGGQARRAAPMAAHQSPAPGTMADGSPAPHSAPPRQSSPADSAEDRPPRPTALERPADAGAADDAGAQRGRARPESGTLPMVPPARQPVSATPPGPAPAPERSEAEEPSTDRVQPPPPPSLPARERVAPTERGADPAAPATPSPPQAGVNPVTPSPPGHEGRDDKSTGRDEGPATGPDQGNAEREHPRRGQDAPDDGLEDETAFLWGLVWRVL